MSSNGYCWVVYNRPWHVCYLIFTLSLKDIFLPLLSGNLHCLNRSLLRCAKYYVKNVLLIIYLILYQLISLSYSLCAMFLQNIAYYGSSQLPNFCCSQQYFFLFSVLITPFIYSDLFDRFFVQCSFRMWVIHGSPQLPLFCCSHQYMLLYYPSLYLVLVTPSICSNMSSRFYIQGPFKTWVIMTLHSFLLLYPFAQTCLECSFMVRVIHDSPQLPIFCCPQNFLFLYDLFFYLWYLLLHSFFQTCLVGFMYNVH